MEIDSTVSVWSRSQAAFSSIRTDVLYLRIFRKICRFAAFFQKFLLEEALGTRPAKEFCITASLGSFGMVEEFI